jgi:hypothetical protein
VRLQWLPPAAEMRAMRSRLPDNVSRS